MRVIYPLWEAFLCCGMCIGLLVLFRERLDFQGRWSKAMARDQYAAYLFHGAMVVLVQYLIRDLAVSPFAKFLLATTASVPLTFLLANLLRRPAFMRRIL